MVHIPTLISVHVPKAGGSSIGRAFAKAFGESLLLTDNDDPADPTNPRWIHPEWYLARRPRSIAPYRVVHGHFPAFKYDLLPEALRVALLRDPVENLISIYYYWKHLCETAYQGHAIFHLFKSQRLTLLETAAIPALRALMSHTYFGGFDMNRLDVIGDYAKRREYLAAVSERVGLHIDPHLTENVTPFSPERQEVLADRRMMAALHDLLLDDVRLYERYAGRGVQTSSRAF
jgi:hypothetical protein